MKKLKYERAEIEVALIDPNMDIITISNPGGMGDFGNFEEPGFAGYNPLNEK